MTTLDALAGGAGQTLPAAAARDRSLTSGHARARQ